MIISDSKKNYFYTDTKNKFIHIWNDNYTVGVNCITRSYLTVLECSNK